MSNTSRNADVHDDVDVYVSWLIERQRTRSACAGAWIGMFSIGLCAVAAHHTGFDPLSGVAAGSAVGSLIMFMVLFAADQKRPNNGAGGR